MKERRLKTRRSEERMRLKQEYDTVNANPIVKGILQVGIMVIDLFVMFLIIWHLFTYFIPQGSWLNIVDGNSMEPTLHNSQIIFTDISSITRGDIVTAYVPDSVIEKYPEKEGLLLIKRVIGLPGDTILITREGISVNGEILKEAYIPKDFEQFTYKEGGCNNIKLQNNEFYLVGDNREVSYDSRTFGAVKEGNILYKQSEKPTQNFYLKATLVLLILIFDIFLYMLIEFILTEITYGVLYKGKHKNKKVDTETEDANVAHTTTETVVIKK